MAEELVDFTYIAYVRWYCELNWDINFDTEKQISTSDKHRKSLWYILEDSINNKLLSLEPKRGEEFYIELSGFYSPFTAEIRLNKSIVERL
jgi:glutathione peroxidase-family protein